MGVERPRATATLHPESRRSAAINGLQVEENTGVAESGQRRGRMSDAFPSRPTTLTDYLAIFRRRLWIVLLPVVLVPALSLVLSAGQKPLYQASAEIYVKRGD